nr:four helix bundle protein [Thiorhodococcus minor]
MDLTVRIYAVSRGFPADERFGITSQMRRAASSIPANIAEGQARNTTGEFLHSLGIARGSLAELETFVELCERLEYIDRPICERLSNDCTEISKMLNALMKSLSTRH